MAALMDAAFWRDAEASMGTVQSDGSLKYILLDRTYRMKPLVRNTSTSFTDYIAGSSDASGCKVVVNGNFYDLTFMGKV